MNDYVDYSFPNGCESEGMNITYEEAEQMLLYSKGATIYTQYILPVFLLVGVLDNTAFIYVVAKQSSMKTATNRYLVNLAVADIVFLIAGIGEKVYKFTQTPFHTDDTAIAPIGCIIIPFVIDTSYFAPLFFISLVSAEIFCAVCYPKGKSLTLHRTWARWLTFTAWVTSAATAGLIIPSNSGAFHTCFNWDDQEMAKDLPRVLTICGTEMTWVGNVAHIVQTVPFFATFFLNGVFYVKIINGLNRSIDRLRAHGTSRRDGDTQLRDQIARMCVVNGFVFFVLLAPFEFLSFMEIADPEFNFRTIDAIHSAARGLTYFNSVVNPIIYTIMSQRYREAFLSAFNPSPKCRFRGTVTTRSVNQSVTYFKMSQTTTKM